MIVINKKLLPEQVFTRIMVSLLILTFVVSAVLLQHQVSGARVRPGVVIHFDGAVAPSGWLSCDGQYLDITVYPELAAYLGPPFVINTTHIRLPDLVFSPRALQQCLVFLVELKQFLSRHLSCPLMRIRFAALSRARLHCSVCCQIPHESSGML